MLCSNNELFCIIRFAVFKKNVITLHHGSVVQWIEFKIPVLTMKVRILSESLVMRWLSDAYFFHRNMGLLHPAIMPLCKVTIFFLIQSILCNFLAYVYRFGHRSKATICGCGNEKIFSSASFEFS